MVITLVSSLTPDDENACAPALLQHFVTVLKQLPIAYAIRIETGDQVYQHSEPLGASGSSAKAATAAVGLSATALASAALPLMH